MWDTQGPGVSVGLGMLGRTCVIMYSVAQIRPQRLRQVTGMCEVSEDEEGLETIAGDLFEGRETANTSGPQDFASGIESKKAKPQTLASSSSMHPQPFCSRVRRVVVESFPELTLGQSRWKESDSLEGAYTTSHLHEILSSATIGQAVD